MEAADFTVGSAYTFGSYLTQLACSGGADMMLVILVLACPRFELHDKNSHKGRHRQSHCLVLRVRNTIRFNPVASVDELESKQDMLAWESFKFRVLCQVITTCESSAQTKSDPA
jgi:hypothetical protein